MASQDTVIPEDFSVASRSNVPMLGATLLLAAKTKVFVSKNKSSIYTKTALGQIRQYNYYGEITRHSDTHRISMTHRINIPMLMLA